MRQIAQRHFMLTIALLFVVFRAMAVTDWVSPTIEPSAQKSKSILFISQDSNNGGISTIFRHFQIATSYLDWKLHYENGQDNDELIKSIILKEAVNYDALILGGIALTSVKNEVNIIKQKGVIVLGWHALAEPGVVDELFINISTYSKDVARLAVDYIKQDIKQSAGIIILNDTRFDVANAKTEQMKNYIQECGYCVLLEVVDINLSQAKILMPEVVGKLNDKYGGRWTYTLAINDSYFDSINFPLKQLNRGDIKNIAAGDGSFLAFSRIKSKQSQQVVTIAEPFALQGWQMADELNRAFANELPSNFVAQPITVTRKNLLENEALKAMNEHDSYREYYLSIWFREKH